MTRRHKAKTLSHATKIINQQKLTPQQEAGLVNYIEGLTKRYLPPTREMIRNFASAIAKEPVSESWVTRFMNRHSIHLISRWAAGMDSNRHNADSSDKYSLYFDLLGDKIKEYDIEPRHTYNMDEKGCLIGVIGRSKRVFSRRMWEENEVRASLQDGSREWVTILVCVCADGSALPPSLIIRLPTTAYNQAGLRISRQDSMVCTSSLHPQAGQTTISALPGSSRCLIATPRQRLDDRSDYLSLIAMDLT